MTQVASRVASSTCMRRMLLLTCITYALFISSPYSELSLCTCMPTVDHYRSVLTEPGTTICLLFEVEYIIDYLLFALLESCHTIRLLPEVEYLRAQVVVAFHPIGWSTFRSASVGLPASIVLTFDCHAICLCQFSCWYSLLGEIPGYQGGKNNTINRNDLNSKYMRKREGGRHTDTQTQTCG